MVAVVGFNVFLNFIGFNRQFKVIISVTCIGTNTGVLRFQPLDRQRLQNLTNCPTQLKQIQPQTFPDVC